MIRKEGELGDCDFCKQKNAKCILPSKLTEHFRPLLEVFRPAERETPVSLDFPLYYYWGIFPQEMLISGAATTLLDRIRPHTEPSPGEITFLDGYDGSLAEDSWCQKDEYRVYPIWKRFKKTVTDNNRHFVRNPSFFKYLDDICDNASVTFSKGKLIYRGRVVASNLKSEGYVGELLFPPPPSLASAGRANVEGVPVFYGAEDEETVVSELRPWLKASITVGEFKTLKDLRILNFTHLLAFRCPFTNGDPRETILRIQLMHQIDMAFSTPLSISDSLIGYVPTQFIASYAKHKHFDGIMYKSAMSSSGRNIALFNFKDTVEVTQISHLKVNNIKYRTEDFIPKNLNFGK